MTHSVSSNIVTESRPAKTARSLSSARMRRRSWAILDLVLADVSPNFRGELGPRQRRRTNHRGGCFIVCTGLANAPAAPPLAVLTSGMIRFNGLRAGTPRPNRCRLEMHLLSPAQLSGRKPPRADLFDARQAVNPRAQILFGISRGVLIAVGAQAFQDLGHTHRRAFRFKHLHHGRRQRTANGLPPALRRARRAPGGFAHLKQCIQFLLQAFDSFLQVGCPVQVRRRNAHCAKLGAPGPFATPTVTFRLSPEKNEV
jgi:hypothetical protein